MPRGDPFSRLCSLATQLARPVVADLHTHSTASDGDFTPSQVLAFARQAGLSAVALTDHDTLAGYDEARKCESKVELVPGVEVSTLWDGRETHLIGLGFDPGDGPLRAMLTRHCDLRRIRFRAMLEALRDGGAAVEPGDLLGRVPSIGRRHLAKLLVAAGLARNLFDAFQRSLTPLQFPPTPWATIEDAVAVIRAAGGVAVLAHPRSDLTEADVRSLHALGMNGLEVAHPKLSSGRSAELGGWCAPLGLLPVGGSDCHGPGTPAVGSSGLRTSDWNYFQQTRTRPK